MSYPSYPNYNTDQGYAPQNAYPGYNPESGQNLDFDNAFTDKTIRQGFIRKVYSILSIQLIISFGSVLLFTHNEQMKDFARHNMFIVIIAFGVAICTMCPLICIQSLRRRTPHNYILLFIFTLAESVILGYMGAATKPEVIRAAVFITAGIVIGLTIFAFQTKWDFTALNGIMFCVLLCFSLVGLAFMFFPKTGLVNMVYSGIGALIFSIYIVIDTQSIVGGNDRKYQISPEEYVFASIMLYLDIINLFSYILSILNEASK